MIGQICVCDLSVLPRIFSSSSLLSGKQLFERDRNLDTSDIQFLEDGKSSSLLCVKASFSQPNEADVAAENLASGPTLTPTHTEQRSFSSAAGNNVEVDESLFQDIEDLDLDEDDPDFDPLQMGSDED